MSENWAEIGYFARLAITSQVSSYSKCTRRLFVAGHFPCPDATTTAALPTTPSPFAVVSASYYLSLSGIV